MSETPADAIEDFEDMYPRPTGINEFSVLHLKDGENTTYECNIETMDCECRDKAFNRSEGEACKHIQVSLYQQPELVDYDREVVRSLSRDISEMRKRIDQLAQKTTVVESEAAAAKAQANGHSAQEEEEGFNGDPVDSFESLLRSEGLDPDEFDVWVDDQYGSLQVEIDGFLGDDEFDQWVEMSNGLDMSYDGDSDVNYLKPDRFPEVLG